MRELRQVIKLPTSHGLNCHGRDSYKTKIRKLSAITVTLRFFIFSAFITSKITLNTENEEIFEPFEVKRISLCAKDGFLGPELQPTLFAKIKESKGFSKGPLKIVSDIENLNCKLKLEKTDLNKMQLRFLHH